MRSGLVLLWVLAAAVGFYTERVVVAHSDAFAGPSEASGKRVDPVLFLGATQGSCPTPP